MKLRVLVLFAVFLILFLFGSFVKFQINKVCCKKNIYIKKQMNELGPKEAKLFDAIYENNKKMVKSILDEGVNVNVKNTAHQAPLHIVQDEDILKMLVEKGADVNAVDEYNMTPIFNKDIVLAKILVEAGADIQIKSNKGNSLLMWYSYSGYSDGVEYLVGLGADVNVKNSDGQTAYDIAQTFGHSELTKYLKSVGAKLGNEILQNN